MELTFVKNIPYAKQLHERGSIPISQRRRLKPAGQGPLAPEVLLRVEPRVVWLH